MRGRKYVIMYPAASFLSGGSRFGSVIVKRGLVPAAALVRWGACWEV